MTPAEIRAHRLRVGLYQVELAAIVGVSRTAVGWWEHGQRRPSREHARRLATAFGLAAPDGKCPQRPAGCGCRCHGLLPRGEMVVLDTRRRTA